MYKEIVGKQLKSIYSLMGINESRIALKSVFEMLIHVASEDAETKESEFEKKSLFEVLRLLFDFLVDSKNMYKNIDYLFEDLIVLAVYFDSINREPSTKQLTSRTNLLVSKIIIILEWYCQETKDGYLTIDSYDNGLLNADKLMYDTYSADKVNILRMYFYIESKFYKQFGFSFWNEAINNLRFVFDDELSWLLSIREGIDEYIKHPETANINICDYEVSDIYEKFIAKNYNIEYVVETINKFRDSDDVVGKKIYKDINQHKEASFHKHLYSYLSTKINKQSILLSELPYNDNRYDIYWHDHDKKLSTIIELKVNDLSEIHKNIKQLDDYLKNINSLICYDKPQFGILCIYNNGENDLDYVDGILMIGHKDYQDFVGEKFDDCIYLKYNNIIISII